jgi:hypothetical protein
VPTGKPSAVPSALPTSQPSKSPHSSAPQAPHSSDPHSASPTDQPTSAGFVHGIEVCFEMPTSIAVQILGDPNIVNVYGAHLL